MQAVKQILAAKGVEDPDEMELGDNYEVEAAGYMDLVIEKVAPGKVSVAHYYEQRGDLMADPEIVFRVDGEDWTAVEYTQHPHVYQRNEEGLPSAQSFSTKWSKNLHRQGFVESAGGEA